MDPTTMAPPTKRKGREIQPDHCYTFWASTGKTIKFKTHRNHSWEMERLTKIKLARKYNKIDVNELQTIWPSVFSAFDNEFVFLLLSGKNTI